MDDCKSCKSKYQELGSRIRHLEGVKWDYDNLKGKGSFKKDQKEAYNLLESLVKKKVDLAVEHAKHDPIVEEEPTEEADYPRTHTI